LTTFFLEQESYLTSLHSHKVLSWVLAVSGLNGISNGRSSNLVLSVDLEFDLISSQFLHEFEIVAKKTKKKEK